MTGEPDFRNPEGGAAPPYFRREDWASFGLAAVVVFGGYWFSLADNVGLSFSGIYSAGANHLGVPHPPGYPLWTIYGWVFTQWLAFENVAWRLALSSTVAAAAACGLIALMVSRSSATLLAGIKGLQRLAPREEIRLRVVAGAVAGSTFGFAGAFWRTAVIVEVWPLSILLFTLTLALLLRWTDQPQRGRYLVAACFTFGLTITNSQALVPAGLGLLCFVACADQDTGRDAALMASALLALWWLGSELGVLPFVGPAIRGPHGLGLIQTRLILGAITLVVFGLYVGLALGTARWLPRATIIVATTAFLAGVSFYLLVPVISMSNPPVNWGYPRNLEGFRHVLSRGQYESIQPTEDARVYGCQLLQFARSTIANLGVFPCLIVLIPLGFLFRMQAAVRRCLAGGLALFASLSLLVVLLLNPPADGESVKSIASYYTPAHLVLAIGMGYGLVLLGTLGARPRVG